MRATPNIGSEMHVRDGRLDRGIPIPLARMICVVGLAALLIGGGHAVAQQRVSFTSKHDAFAQGLSAYHGRSFAIAVPALQFAADRGLLRAKYYLARIYSDNSGGWTDHARAYSLLSEIVTRHANVDPKDFRVAPYVSRALTSIARYERDGIAALKLRPNTRRALTFFDHAATHFNHPDAQFELAKHFLSGDGVKARVPYALNWLARLSRRGHAGAQAFLANLYWDGRYMRRNPVRALALITVAVENANSEDRFWIEDVHQNIFCEAQKKTRQQVKTVVGGWRQRYAAQAQAVSVVPRVDLEELSGETKRICANGDIVGDLEGVEASDSRQPSGGEMATVTKPSQNQLVRPEAESKPKLGNALSNSTDRRRLNGFGVQATRADSQTESKRNGTNQAGVGLSIRPESDATSQERQERRRELNGFTLQGSSSSFGFSVAPKR